MTDEDRALGERWLKAGGGWCVGMTSPAVGNNTFHVIALDNEGVPVEWLATRNYAPSAIVTAYGRPGWARVVWADQVPDFGNPAVRGLALDVLRRRWGGDIWIGGRLTAAERIVWWVCGLHRSDDLRVNGGHGFDSEQQALVVAMEAVR